jgi:hypothetical protein
MNEARAERVRAIAEDVAHGKVLSREGERMTFEVPADMAPGLASLWGQSSLVPIFIGQDVRLAPRRVVNSHGVIVVCDDAPAVTTAFYKYRVDL